MLEVVAVTEPSVHRLWSKFKQGMEVVSLGLNSRTLTVAGKKSSRFEMLQAKDQIS